MLEFIVFLAAVGGAAVGGWFDLKTTEIPDEVPLFIAVAGILAHIYQAVSLGSMAPLISSFVAGLFLLSMGYILYFSGQWGEADALLLGALGIILPAPLSFFNMSPEPLLFGLSPILDMLAFPITFMFNVFLVGGAYSILYTIFMIANNRKIIRHLGQEISKSTHWLLIMSAAYFALSAGIYLIVAFVFEISVPMNLYFMKITSLFPLVLIMLVLYRLAKGIDSHAFMKTISTSKLLEGDVLASPVKGVPMKGKLWIGLTKKQVAQIRKKAKTVKIKEGIRFAPTFFLALLATAAWGNIFIRIAGLL